MKWSKKNEREKWRKKGKQIKVGDGIGIGIRMKWNVRE